MKWLNALLLLLLLGLHYRIWVGENSFAYVHQLEQQLRTQESVNARLVERNRLLLLDVEALKTDLDAIEARARTELGMIRRGETLYLLADDSQP